MGKKKPPKAREQRVLERVRRATVGVALSKREGDQVSLTLEGTGFFIDDPSGVVLTARHVLDAIEPEDDRGGGEMGRIHARCVDLPTGGRYPVRSLVHPCSSGRQESGP